MILGKTKTDIAPVMQQLNTVNEWEVNAFEDREEAINHFVANDFLDVVIFTEALEEETKNGLQKLFTFQQEDVIVLSAMEEAGIRDMVNEALHKLADNKRPKYAFVDDALKHAKFNICLN